MAKDDALWKAFSIYIRMRDADADGMVKCCTCQTVDRWTKMEAGHGIGRAKWGTRYDERNVAAQCPSCNRYHGGRKEQFAVYVDKRYGKGTWAELIQKSGISKRPPLAVLDAMTKLYQQKVKDILQGHIDAK